MVQYFEACVGLVAPYYNLVLVVIVVILFLKLFSLKNKNAYLKPWKLLFFAIIVYIIEESVTVLENLDIVRVSKLLFPLFEMVIIVSFIYMLLLQKEYINKQKLK